MATKDLRERILLISEGSKANMQVGIPNIVSPLAELTGKL